MEGCGNSAVGGCAEGGGSTGGPLTQLLTAKREGEGVSGLRRR